MTLRVSCPVFDLDRFFVVEGLVKNVGDSACIVGVKNVKGRLPTRSSDLQPRIFSWEELAYRLTPCRSVTRIISDMLSVIISSVGKNTPRRDSDCTGSARFILRAAGFRPGFFFLFRCASMVCPG